MIGWIETTQERYDEMMGAVPPIMAGWGFLVGEAVLHRPCRVSGSMRAAYDAFAEIDGRFYAAQQSLTMREFMALTRDQILAGAQP